MTKKPKTPVPVLRTHSVSEAFELILRHNLNSMVLWEQSARNWSDIAGVHQTRVALRRMRSAITTFHPAVPKNIAAKWNIEMRDLAAELGRARDLDVFIDEVLNVVEGKLPLRGEEALRALVQGHRSVAYEKVRVILDSERYACFKQNFGLWIENREWEHAEIKKKQRKYFESSLLVFSRKVLDRQMHRVLDIGTQLNRESTEGMHRLRIECKKLRYAAEFFSPLFNGMEEFIHHMKAIQELLGVMNDVKVMRNLLEEMLADTQDSDVLEYAGGVIGWRSFYFNQLLESFDRRFYDLVEAKRPWWKKSDFN